MHYRKTCVAFAAIFLATLLALPAISSAQPKKGRPAPPIQVVSISGQRISMANYRGSVLVLEFFASWCGGCKESIPHLIGLQRQFGKQGLQILGLDIGQGDTLEDLREFAAKRKISFPVAMADEEIVYDKYGISMIPTIFVINRKGILMEKFSGFSDETSKTLEATVKRLLAE